MNEAPIFLVGVIIFAIFDMSPNPGILDMSPNPCIFDMSPNPGIFEAIADDPFDPDVSPGVIRGEERLRAARLRAGCVPVGAAAAFLAIMFSSGRGKGYRSNASMHETPASAGSSRTMPRRAVVRTTVSLGGSNTGRDADAANRRAFARGLTTRRSGL